MNQADFLREAFNHQCELVREGGSIVKAEARAQIDDILDAYNELISQTFVNMVEVDMVEGAYEI